MVDALQLKILVRVNVPILFSADGESFDSQAVRGVDVDVVPW